MSPVSIRWRLEPVTVERFSLNESGAQAFGAFRPVNPGLDVLYYSDHVREDGWRLPGGVGSPVRTLTVDFDAAMESAGTLSYTVAGTAVEDTHFRLVTPSPLPLNAGSTKAEIIIELLDSGSYFVERSIIVTLTGGDSFTVLGQAEFRLWVYSSRTAPLGQWRTAGASGAAGTYNIHADIDAVSQELVELRYLVDTTLTEGVHYELVTPSGVGYIGVGNTGTDQPGSQRVQFTLTPAGGTQTGAVIDFHLDLPRQDRINSWTHTGNWKYEVYELPFPGEPSAHGSGGGVWLPQFVAGSLVIGQDETLDPETGLPFWNIPAANRKLRPDTGEPMQAILMRPEFDELTSNAYTRGSFELEAFAGGPALSQPLKRWNMVAVYLDTLPSPEDSRTHQFFAITIRTRTKNLENRCIFWRLSDGDDATGVPSVIHSNGATLQTVTLSTGTWGFWTGENQHASDLWGAEEETIDGVPYTRVWFAHHVPDAGFEYTNNDGDLKTQQQGDIANVIVRFTYYAPGDNSGSRALSSSQIVGGTPGAAGKGFLAWGPMYVQSDNVFPDPPPAFLPNPGDHEAEGRYWPRLGNWQEPYGGAYLDTAGNTMYTFTVA